MSANHWLLPDAIEDVLPLDAARIESLRRLLLDMFQSHGYKFIMPPLLEYVESLVTGSSHDLDLRTFKLVDQISGRTLGLRADITPQVARIDAHPLNRHGISRLCYCGSVLHTLPEGFNATREPLQIGAEIYGHQGIEADIEIVCLLSEVLRLSSLDAIRIDLGHVGIFHALLRDAGMNAVAEQAIFSALQAKDIPTLRELTQGMNESSRSALLALPELYGGREVLDRARRLLPAEKTELALNELQQLAEALPELPISFDLADLRGYDYHNGIVFAAYHANSSGAIALGGRYDEIGKSYGKARPATGFSMDLRIISQLSPQEQESFAILAPWNNDNQLSIEVLRLRELGEIVWRQLPGHEGTQDETNCDRQLVLRDGKWLVEPISTSK
ncbi:MAG: ATP phosphoribosyltransferase regulatory subunit [Georgfuchsia sp.]